jgi:hypothetical protein
MIEAFDFVGSAHGGFCSTPFEKKYIDVIFPAAIVSVDSALFKYFLVADLEATRRGSAIRSITVIAGSVYQANPSTLALEDEGETFPEDISFGFNCVRGADIFLSDLAMLGGDTPVLGLKEPWMRRTAYPLITAWEHYTNNRGQEALRMAASVQDEGWRNACLQWLKRNPR